MSDKLIEVDRITAAYDGKVVLKDISFILHEHDFLGIAGPNGCGKTTLLKIILGLLKPIAGRVAFYRNGLPVASAVRMGYLPQINQIDRRFPISVREVIASGLMAEKPRFRSFRPEQNRRIDNVAAQMGVEKLSPYPIGELSGGQLQRVLLGRAIVSEPQVLILDEPGSYLDKQFESYLYPLLKEINRESAVIMVSHDTQTLESLTDNTIHIPQSL
ncbi:MAG: ATP-binding cassette domain-containing protein [Tannerellaceae bacterium]|jgi:zinc transport system ATP-binding protein|nr:ATP-binding cassette domain-containing protein [Tannerellaceae bacterium]